MAVLPEWAERLVAEVNAHSWIRYGTSPQTTPSVTSHSVDTTLHAIGLNGRFFSCDEAAPSVGSVSGCYEENGKRLMSDSKSIVLNLGGRWDFRVTKVFSEDNERFTVTLGSLDYGRGIEIAGLATWVEASQAMNKFKDEFETAFLALVESSTLTPVGVHEES